MSRRKIALMIAIAIVSVGCVDGGSNSAPPNTPPATPAPPPPSSPYDSTQDTTVEGKDDNGNGIRDDIDELIAETYGGASADQVEYIRSIAQNIQSSLVDNGAREHNLRLTVEGTTYLYCLRQSGFDQPSSVEDALFDATVNTQLREDALIGFLQSTGGAGVDIPYPVSCE